MDRKLMMFLKRFKAVSVAWIMLLAQIAPSFSQSQQAPVIIPPGLQIVASRGQILGQSANVGGDTTTRTESRYQFTGGCDFWGAQVAFGNYTVGSGTGEADGPNDITVSAALETVASSGTINQVAVSRPLLFNGLTTQTLNPQAYSLLTDVLSADFPAGGTFFLRTNVSYAALAFSPVGFNASLGGSAEQAYKSSNATSQVYSTGALAAGTNGTTITAGYGPLTFLGRPLGPCASVVGIGDSIMFGQGDAAGGNAAGARGWIQRGLATAQTNGLPIAYAMEARSSDTPAQNTRSNSWRKRAMWKYGNVLICELGINQLGPTSQAAQLAYLQDIWLSGKRQGMQVWQTLITPQTTSTDSWATLANQTVDATFAANRAALNASIIAAVASGLIDGYIDPNPYLADPGQPDKFQVNGTANYATPDGTHPTQAFAISMSAAIVAVVPRFSTKRVVNYLLNRDLGGAANDNSPAFLAKVG